MLETHEYKAYRKSLAELKRKGGAYTKAADKAIVIQDCIRNGVAVDGQMTNNGETRIKKAYKYDIGAGCRLVTVQDNGYAFILFAGTHDDVERWIESNRGISVGVDTDGMKPVVVFVTDAIEKPRTSVDIGYSSELLLSLVDVRLKNALLNGLSFSIAERIANVEAFVSDDEVLELVDGILDFNQQSAIIDTIVELKQDNIDAAERRIRLFTGEIKEIEDLDGVDMAFPLQDSEDFQKISVDSEYYRKLIEHYARNADYKDWMLFMHPDQQKYVDEDYEGPAKLSGVSGSGKTCVVVKRAIRLAEKYPDEQILVLTLNRSLAILIEDLVTSVAPASVHGRIEVLPLFRLCQKQLEMFEPGNERLYSDVTWKSFEHIDEVWREFYRCELNFEKAEVLLRLHDSLIARGIDAEKYIREEVDWVRSALSPSNRQDYLTIDRVGRTYALDERFRNEVLSGLEYWEEKMEFVGVIDQLGVTNALHKHLKKLTPAYRCVLVDESQDFGTTEMALVRTLVRPAENDIFLCGDAAQQVSAKRQSLSDAGIAVGRSRSNKLTLNYRNSRQILDFAYSMLIRNLSEEIVDGKDFEVLDPKFASFGGPAPLLLSADSFSEELASAIAYAREDAKDNPNKKICIAVCGYSEHELSKFAAQQGMQCLNGETQLEQAQIFISDLDNTKGFEFQTVIIVNCSAGVIPHAGSPIEEEFRDLSRLYVAMTRARNQLILSFTGEVSRFVADQLDKVSTGEWCDHRPETFELSTLGTPKRLDELRNVGVNEADFLNMSGPQYLYQDHAIGCDGILVEKLRNAVSGESRVVNGAAVEWETIGEAMHDTQKSIKKATSRKVFGREGYNLFFERFSPMRGK